MPTTVENHGQHSIWRRCAQCVNHLASAAEFIPHRQERSGDQGYVHALQSATNSYEVAARIEKSVLRSNSPGMPSDVGVDR